MTIIDDVTATYIIISLFIGVGIGYWLRADVQPWIARWLDRRDTRGG